MRFDDLTWAQTIYYASAAEFIALRRIPEHRRTDRQVERFESLNAPIEDEPEEDDAHEQ